MAPGAVGRHRRHVVEAVVGDSHAVALVEAEVDHLEAAGLLVADHHVVVVAASHVVVVVASHVAAGEVDLGAAVGGSKQVRECTQDPALLPRSGGRRRGRKLHTSVFLTTWVSAQPDTSLRQPHRTSRMPRGPYPLVKHCGPRSMVD